MIKTYSKMMNFVLPTPSLQHLAEVKIVGHLWNQVRHFSIYFHRSVSVDQCANELIWRLPLPVHSKKRLIDLIKPLGSEILHWCQYDTEYDDNRIRSLNPSLLPKHVYWTMHGTVDYTRTAALVVKDERVDLQRRFEMACLYCLEDEARRLFQRVAEERGEEWVPILRYDDRDDLSDLILFFARSINLDVRYMDEESPWLPNEPINKRRLFARTLHSNNRAMCEYIFNNLNGREKERVLERGSLLFSYNKPFPTCNLLYYLSRLNREQQRCLFRERVIVLLNILFRWPMQSLFMEAARRGWQFMDHGECSEMLSEIIFKISRGEEDCDYSQLFWECWGLSTADFKQIYLDGFWHLECLLRTKREEFIKLVLNEAPANQILALCGRHLDVSHVLMDERVISDAVWMECAETAALKSAKDKENKEKRLRSQHLTKLIEVMTGGRMERREPPQSISTGLI